MNPNQNPEDLHAAIDAAIAGKPWEFKRTPESPWEPDNKAAGFGWRIDNHFLVRAKTWSLPAPPEGREWHRTDWTEEMLPEPFRPLLKGEVSLYMEDEASFGGGDKFCAQAGNLTINDGHLFWRTRRPLPTAPKLRPWSEPSDVPGPVCWMRNTSFHLSNFFVTEIREDSIIIGASQPARKEWDELIGWEHSTDRIT